MRPGRSWSFTLPSAETRARTRPRMKRSTSRQYTAPSSAAPRSVSSTTGPGPSWPADVHGLGMSLGTWVVDDPTAALALMRSGVDAVATNDPGPLVTARREALGS